jgi:hypothetical protein
VERPPSAGPFGLSETKDTGGGVSAYKSYDSYEINTIYDSGGLPTGHADPVGKSSIKTQIGVNLPNDVYEVLRRRAEVRGVSISRYASMFFEDWKAKGYPAIDAIDSTARALVKQQMIAENVTDTLAAGETDADPVEGGRSANAKSRRIHRKAAA